MDLKGFQIPIQLQDLFNKIFQKQESLYTREETPVKVTYTYKERQYRGIPIPYIDKIVIEYASSYGTEVYTGVRDEQGNLLSTRKVISKQNPATMVSG